MAGTKERILDTTAELFRRYGYTGTGLKQIVAEANAPFGSIYHFFPGGKAAARRGGDPPLGRDVPASFSTIIFDAAPDPVTGIARLLPRRGRDAARDRLRRRLPDRDRRARGREHATSPCARRRPTCSRAGSRPAPTAWRTAGIARRKARELTISAIAALEGAFVLSRAMRSTEPLEVDRRRRGRRRPVGHGGVAPRPPANSSQAATTERRQINDHVWRKLMPEVELSAGTIEYQDTGGSGPVVVLLHGVVMDGSVWRHVVNDLRSDHRCIVPTLPLGAHRQPMRQDADLSLRGHGRIVAELLERLDLRDVTLVQNDHAAALAMVVERPERVARLVISSVRGVRQLPARPARQEHRAGREATGRALSRLPADAAPCPEATAGSARMDVEATDSARDHRRLVSPRPDSAWCASRPRPLRRPRQKA